MATNGTSLAAEPRLEEEIFGIQAEHDQPMVPRDEQPVKRRNGDHRTHDPGYSRSVNGSDGADIADDFALAPLIDKMAFNIARGLGVAMKELEDHIAAGARRVSDTIERQMSLLQAGMTEMTSFVQEQRSLNLSMQESVQQIAAANESLREADARHAAELDHIRTETQGFSMMVAQQIQASTASLHESGARTSAELEALRDETREFSASVLERIDVTVAALNQVDEKQAQELTELQAEVRASARSIGERIESICKEIGVQQEDVATINSTLSTTCSRIDSLVERLDRQADAVRLLHTSYSQRETELEQLVDGLARLRAFPKPVPMDGL